MAGDRKTLEKTSRVLLIVWIILLVPCVLLILPSGMAFDGGYSWKAYTFVVSIWTYPLMLIAAAVFRKRAPVLIFLPVLSIAGFFLGGY